MVKHQTILGHEMEFKSCEIAIKQAHEGKVVATLATLGVRDRDGDILNPGLLNGRQLVAIKPQHKWDHVDLGVAETYERGNTMEASMEFNMAIPAARDWFEAIRFSHEKNRRQQYSFGFEVVDFESGAHEGQSVRFLKRIAMAEVSPVLIGASVGSQTLVVKGHRRSLWPGGLGVTNSLGTKEHIGEAVTSLRSGRRHMQRVRRLMDEEKSAAKTMRMNEYMDAAIDDLDTALEHYESAVDLIDSLEAAPPVIVPVTQEKAADVEVPKESPISDTTPAELERQEPTSDEPNEQEEKSEHPETFQAMTADVFARFDEWLTRIEHRKGVRMSEGRSLSAADMEKLGVMAERITRAQEVRNDAPGEDNAATVLFDRFKSQHLNAML